MLRRKTGTVGTLWFYTVEIFFSMIRILVGAGAVLYHKGYDTTKSHPEAPAVNSVLAHFWEFESFRLYSRSSMSSFGLCIWTR